MEVTSLHFTFKLDRFVTVLRAGRPGNVCWICSTRRSPAHNLQTDCLTSYPTSLLSSGYRGERAGGWGCPFTFIIWHGEECMAFCMLCLRFPICL